MTSSIRSYDPITRRRGTRGFAAVVTALAGFVSLAAGLVVASSPSVDATTRSWVVILAVSFAVAHAFAVVGLIRARRWAGRLVGYLAAIGIGVASYALLRHQRPPGRPGPGRRRRALDLDDRRLARRPSLRSARLPGASRLRRPSHRGRDVRTLTSGPSDPIVSAWIPSASSSSR